MTFLGILSSLGVSEIQIKDIFAKHLGEDSSEPDVAILEKDEVGPNGVKNNYGSDMKSISVLVRQGFTDGLATFKIANFLTKTPTGMFLANKVNKLHAIQ